MRKKITLATLVAIVTACGSGESEKRRQQPLTQAQLDQQLCEQHVVRDLMNPETVEFFEFEPINRDDARFRPSVLEETFSSLSDFRQYRMRYKADSKVGLKVTSIERCDAYKHAKGGQMCTCSEAP